MIALQAIFRGSIPLGATIQIIIMKYKFKPIPSWEMGRRKTVKKYAWFPKCLYKSRTWIWFEHYEQIFSAGYMPDEWIVVSEYCIRK